MDRGYNTPVSIEFVGDFTDCTKLRMPSENVRYLRTEYGSSNVSNNGHPSVTGALDAHVLCTFREDGVCDRKTATRPASRETQQAVRSHQTRGQIMNTYRSEEMRVRSKVDRDTKRHMARCARLAEDVSMK